MPYAWTKALRCVGWSELDDRHRRTLGRSDGHPDGQPVNRSVDRSDKQRTVRFRTRQHLFRTTSTHAVRKSRPGTANRSSPQGAGARGIRERQPAIESNQATRTSRSSRSASRARSRRLRLRRTAVCTDRESDVGAGFSTSTIDLSTVPREMGDEPKTGCPHTMVCDTNHHPRGDASLYVDRAPSQSRSGIGPACAPCTAMESAVTRSRLQRSKCRPSGVQRGAHSSSHLR